MGLIETGIILVVALIVACYTYLDEPENNPAIHMWMKINAHSGCVNVFWENAIYYWSHHLVITIKEPGPFRPVFTKDRKIFLSANTTVLTSYELEDVNFIQETPLFFDFEASRRAPHTSTCYAYWANIIEEDGTTILSSCIKTYPLWMNELRPIIGDLRIRDLFIPGTHSSGSYLGKVNVTQFMDVVQKYDWTQDDDVYGQLIHGARYLDISIGYYKKEKEHFFINRGLSRQRPLSVVIKQIKDFVKETKEIVIINLTNFPVGFTDLKVYKNLSHYLINEFGNMLMSAPLSWNNTLNDLWEQQQTVIITSSNRNVTKSYTNVFLGAIKQRWGNAKDIPHLRTHLRKIKSYDPMRQRLMPIAFMAVLTPVKDDILKQKFGGFRKMTNDVNQEVSELFYKELGEHANIVAVDFIRSSTLVETAIEYNKLRKRLIIETED